MKAESGNFVLLFRVAISGWKNMKKFSLPSSWDIALGTQILWKLQEIHFDFWKHSSKMLEPHWEKKPLPAHNLYSSRSTKLKLFLIHHETPCTMYHHNKHPVPCTNITNTLSCSVPSITLLAWLLLLLSTMAMVTQYINQTQGIKVNLAWPRLTV